MPKGFEGGRRKDGNPERPKPEPGEPKIPASQVEHSSRAATSAATEAPHDTSHSSEAHAPTSTETTHEHTVHAGVVANEHAGHDAHEHSAASDEHAATAELHADHHGASETHEPVHSSTSGISKRSESKFTIGDYGRFAGVAAKDAGKSLLRAGGWTIFGGLTLLFTVFGAVGNGIAKWMEKIVVLMTAKGVKGFQEQLTKIFGGGGGGHADHGKEKKKDDHGHGGGGHGGGHGGGGHH